MELLPLLEKFESRYNDIQNQLCNPEVLKDKDKFSSLSKEFSFLQPLVDSAKEYRILLDKKDEAEKIISESNDSELKAMADEELKQLEQALGEKESQILSVFVRKGENEDQQVIVEIRQGTGGQEAALFARDLFKMYSKFCQEKKLKVEVLNSHPTDIKGYKEIIFSVKGKGAHSYFKYESGVHRVQRVPVTESGGRIHTSTSTVAVLEEPREIELKINPDELKIDTFRASGHGGQHVNVTDSAVRITHIPTGIIVSCQDERSQLKNKAKAMRILRARLYSFYREKQHREISQKRKSQVGTGERAEKVRTYNFPENRVTDHRVNVTLYKLERILEGDLADIIEALKNDEVNKSLEEMLREDEQA